MLRVVTCHDCFLTFACWFLFLGGGRSLISAGTQTFWGRSLISAGNQTFLGTVSDIGWHSNILGTVSDIGWQSDIFGDGLLYRLALRHFGDCL